MALRSDITNFEEDSIRYLSTRGQQVPCRKKKKKKKKKDREEGEKKKKKDPSVLMKGSQIYARRYCTF